MPAVVPGVAAAASAFGGLFGSGGAVAGLLGTSIVGGFTVGQGLLLAGGVALQGVTGALSKSRAEKAARSRAGSIINNTAELALPRRDANPPARLVFGRATTSGDIVHSKTDGTHLWLVMVFAAHECDAIEAVFLDNREVLLDANGDAFEAPFLDGATVNVSASLNLGTDDQALDSILAADVTELSSDFRLRGNCYAVLKLRQGADQGEHREIYGDQLIPRFRLRGAKVYDPRDPGQSLSDSGTWQWSDNAALCMMRYLTFDQLYGGGVDTERIAWDRVADAADVCDLAIPTSPTEYERQFTANGVILSTDERYEALQQFAAAMAGDLIMPAGKMYPLPAQRKAPTATIHSGLVVGGIEYQPRPPQRDLPNTARIELVDPESNYQIIPGPEYTNSDAVTEDGEAREITLRFGLVLGEGNAARGQRLAKINVARARLGRSLSMEVAYGYETAILEPGDVVRVELASPFDFVNGVYEVQRIVENPRLYTMGLQLVEWSDDVLGWTAGEVETWVRNDEAA